MTIGLGLWIMGSDRKQGPLSSGSVTQVGLLAAVPHHRRRQWGTFMAVRTIFTAVLAIGAAVIVDRVALPAVIHQAEQVGGTIPAWADMLIGARAWLPFMPVPGLLLAFAALIFRPLRPLLALLAAIATALAVIAIFATLVAAFLPLYQVPQ